MYFYIARWGQKKISNPGSWPAMYSGRHENFGTSLLIVKQYPEIFFAGRVAGAA
jgi:hypothetical protein